MIYIFFLRLLHVISYYKTLNIASMSFCHSDRHVSCAFPKWLLNLTTIWCVYLPSLRPLHVFHSFSNWVVFLLLSFESSLYTVDMNPWAEIVVCKYFSLSDFSFCLLNRVVCKATDFRFNEVESSFHFMVCGFGVKSKNSLSSPRVQSFFLWFC